MTLFLRRTIFAFVLGAALAAAVFVGRAAQATTGQIDACFKPSNGTLYLLGGDSGRTECQPGDIPISWNTAGVNGRDGTSVTSESLAPGDDPACPNGGSRFTAANDSISYACNGSNGQDGVDGVNGVDGVTATVQVRTVRISPGTFTSPNGQFQLVVDNTTREIGGADTAGFRSPANSVQLQTQGLFSASGAVTIDRRHADLLERPRMRSLAPDRRGHLRRGGRGHGPSQPSRHA